MTAVADAINNRSGAAGSSWVGRQVFASGLTATVTSVAGDMALTDRAGSIPLDTVPALLLPTQGEVVTFYGQRMVWLETDLFRTGQPGGWVLSEAGEVEYRVGAVEQLVCSGVSEDSRWVEALCRQRRSHEQWKQGLAADARAWADDNDLCERFDDFMERHDMEGRLKEFGVEVTVKFHRTIEAHSWDEASEVTDEQVREWIAEGASFDCTTEAY